MSLAGIGPDKTKVKILADPTSDKNVHETEPSQPQDQLHGCPLGHRAAAQDHLDPGPGDVTDSPRSGSDSAYPETVPPPPRFACAQKTFGRSAAPYVCRIVR